MTDSDGRARAIAAELLAQAQMPDGQVAERARFAADPQYWSGLAPEMSVGNAPRAASRSVPVATLDAVRRHFATDGYFQTPPLLDQSDLARLNGAIDAVTGAGWPPVFAWVYDAFWVLARLPDVSDLLASQLGAGFSQIPHVWTHVVPATVGATGWPPHFDGPSRGRASIWIALTDATLANGCMHLVPRRRLSDAFTTEPLDTGRVPLVDALRALHGVRALPAPPGAVLGWTFDVLHWGGACLSAEGTRRAISLEFIAAGEAPNPDELPLLPCAGALPPFADRLRMISTAVIGYEKFEPGLVRHRAVAERLRGRSVSGTTSRRRSGPRASPA